MLTTQDLLKQLHDARMSRIGKNAVQPDPLLTEVCNRIDEFPSESEESEQGRQHAKKIMSFIGGKGMAQILEYWHLRDEVQAYQRQHQISGVETVSTTIAGQTIEYKRWNDQLLLLDSDIPLLKADIAKVANFFCDMVQKLEYKLFRRFYLEDDQEDFIPATLLEVKTFASFDRSVEAWLYTESIQWEKNEVPKIIGGRVSDYSGHFVKKFLPDSLEINFTLDRPDEDPDTVRFIAENPDPARFPFRAV